MKSTSLREHIATVAAGLALLCGGLMLVGMWHGAIDVIRVGFGGMVASGCVFAVAERGLPMPMGRKDRN